MTAKTTKITFSGLLLALAITLSVVESQITAFLGLTPGVKLGLSNIVTMYALMFLGSKEGCMLAGLKALFALLTRGVTAGLLSFLGGYLSLAVMILLLQFRRHVHFSFLSVCGALAHNAGQLFGVFLILKNAYVFGYAPILMISAVFMGVLTSISLRAVLPALQGIGVHPLK